MTGRRRVKSLKRNNLRRQPGRMPQASLFRAKLGLALLVSVVLVGSVVSAPTSPASTKESVR